MKPIYQFLAIIALTALSAHARTWTSADGKSSFEGELIEFNATTGQVTVDRGGKHVTFKKQMLSDNDIAFLTNTKAAPTTTPKPAEPSNQKPLAVTPINNTAAAASNTTDYTFKPAPFDKRSTWLIKNFGPVGIGIMLEKGPVMKINSDLGYEPVTYSELTQDEKFWAGCKSCVNYDILMAKDRKNCLCMR